MNKIITIGREFGSGGRELGRRLSEELEIAYYDNEIISEISRKTSLSEQYVQAVVEHTPVYSFPIHIGRSFYAQTNPVFEQQLNVYREQARIIREMAAASDCVIVGRCADYILREWHPFRIFVYADMDSKIERCRKKGPEDEALSEKELRQKIKGIDKQRARYYEAYTGNPWGDKLNFDFCINTTHMDIKKVVPAMAKIFK